MIGILLAVALSLSMFSPAAFASESPSDAQALPGSTEIQTSSEPGGDAQATTSGTIGGAVEEGKSQVEGEFTTLEEAVQAGAASDVPDNPEAFAAGEIIVVLKSDDAVANEVEAVEEEIDEISETEGAVVELIDDETDEQPTAVVELPADVSVADALLAAANSDEVAYAQPNFLYRLLEDESAEGAQQLQGVSPLATVNDPNFSIPDRKWWLDAVNAYDAWDVQKTEGEVTVAVIDTGARLTHDDLDNTILQNLAWDAYRKQLLSESVSKNQISQGGDVWGHGTHVAGIVAAEANNNLLGAGVSYNANILPINVSYLSEGKLIISTLTIRSALDYIINNKTAYNIRVVNISLGGYASDGVDHDLHDKIRQAYDNGILCVCAAGNDNTSAISYPSDWDEVISVTSIDSDFKRSSFSDHNAHKDIAAPGGFYKQSVWPESNTIFSTTRAGDSSGGYMHGTSMASPVVAGIAAMLFAANPDLTVDQAKQILYGTARDQLSNDPLDTPGRDDYYGWGVVDAAEAVLEAAGGGSPQPGAEPTAPTPASPQTEKYYPGCYSPTFDVTLRNAFTIKAEGGNLSYQWYSSESYLADGALDSATAISGATRAYYQPPNNNTRRYFYCKISNTLNGSAAFAFSRVVLDPYNSAVPVTLTAGSVTKPYDGRALTASSCSASYPPGVTSAVAWLQGSQTAIGSSLSTVARYILYADASRTIDVTAYYTNVTLNPGTLTVTKPPVTPAARLEGSTRYDTMVAVNNQGFSAADTDVVILSTGEKFPDALAAAGLAGVTSAPIVTTAPNALSSQAHQMIARLQPKKIYLLGSDDTISYAVENQLNSEFPGVTLKRLAGSDRYLTALQIYREGAEIGTWGKTAIVACGEKFPDALSVSPLSYAGKFPIFLASTGSGLPALAVEAIRAGGFTEVVLLGGSNSVPQAVEVQLSGLNLRRLEGADRYQTSVQVAAYSVATLPGQISISSPIVTTGTKPYDALSGGVLGGKTGNVLLLADSGDSGYHAIGDYLKPHSGSIGRAFILGSRDTLSDPLVETIRASIQQL
ncbi:MAG: S8 family serine peptidase [Coriobacteriales bacterium]|jgi:subtilisin family serine protease/putative cell wall-binding protein|nr:S8 family serine peptidase [Coriobacteriales bacterium]